MTDTSAVKRIGIFGHVGNGNLGDEAIFSVVIQNIRSRCPAAEIRCFTVNPDDTRRRHRLAAFPIRRNDTAKAPPPASEPEPAPDNHRAQPRARPAAPSERVKNGLKALPWAYSLLRTVPRIFQALKAAVREPGFLLQGYRNLKGVDLLIIAGSQQLIDYVAGGAWGHPYTLFKWVLLARARKTKIAFVSCGAGPIRTALGGFFIRSALSVAQYRSYRDEASRKCVAQLGVAAADPVFPDLVYSLRVDDAALPGKAPASARPVVGINPLPFLEPRYWVGGSARNYEMYIGKLADFAAWLIQRGHDVLFFPTQLRGDPPVIEDIKTRMRQSGIPDLEKHLIDYSVRSFEDLVAAISMTDIVVATRFHGVVVSYLLNRPVLGIAYAVKTNDLMEQVGQGEFALDILRLDLQSLQERFLALESRKAAIKAALARHIAGHRQALDVQYDRILRLLQQDG
jgi:polysaccharide pyruvyl transferase WcaK-like protein